MRLSERVADWLTGGDYTTTRIERDAAVQRCAVLGAQLSDLRRRLADPDTRRIAE